MRPTSFLPRLSCLALLAATALLPIAAAQAQGVQMFDEAPSIEQLRSIMIPMSNGGASRSIVLAPQPHAANSSVQMVSTHVPAATTLPPLRQPKTDAAPPPVQTASAAIAAPVAKPDTATPAPAPAPAANAVGFRINFALDSDAIPPSAHSFIDSIGAFLSQEKSLKLRIEGHTDAFGSSEYNLDLSRRRGQAVAAYLVAQGIAADRLVVVGQGKTAPLLDDPYDPRNRRVQFARID